MNGRWFWTLVALLIAPAAARSQPVFAHAESIDSTVCNADAVYLGVLTETQGARTVDATLVVEETLKGEHRDRVLVRFPANRPPLPSGVGPRARVLVTVRSAPANTLNGTPTEVVKLIELSGKDGEVLDAEFTLHRGPVEIPRAARDAIRRRPGVTSMEGLSVLVPYRALAGTHWAVIGNLYLTLPVDERLERWALDTLEGTGLGDRRRAVLALRYFKSEANILRVKALLDDPGRAELSRAQENLGRQAFVYIVRAEAFATLTYWGIKVAEPVTEEASDRPDLVTLVVYGNSWVKDAQLDELARFPNLEYLDLVNEPITDARLKRIAGLKTLRTLNLGGTQVTDAGLGELAAMAGLRYLDLAADHLTGEGLAKLAGLKELATVDLRQSWASDAAIKPLAALVGLKKVDLSETRVSAEGLAELRRLRPDLDIQR